MRVIKTKENSLFIETNQEPQVVTDHQGMRYYYVQTPPLNEVFRLLDTPLLEDIFAEVRMELMERDSRSIPDRV